MQRFFAQNWPLRLWMAIVPLIVPIIVWWRVGSWAWISSHWQNGLMFAWILLLAWLIGSYFALLVGWPILGPLYYERGIKNGAPYRVGDFVRILAGRYRGRLVRVYEIWDERNQVRVELGEVERERVRDVFSYVEVCRELLIDSSTESRT